MLNGAVAIGNVQAVQNVVSRLKKIGHDVTGEHAANTLLTATEVDGRHLDPCIKMMEANIDLCL